MGVVGRRLHWLGHGWKDQEGVAVRQGAGDTGDPVRMLLRDLN